MAALRPPARRPQQQQQQSLLASLVLLALSPAMYAAAVFRRWLRLPLTLSVRCLTLADAVVSELLTLLTKQPCPKMQLRSSQQTIATLQRINQTQAAQILLLQSELDGLRLELSKSQRRTLELAEQSRELQQRLSSAVAEARASAAGASPRLASAAQHAGGPGAAASQGKGGPSCSSGEPAPLPARRWYLHACVALAALGVRWWLLVQTDPLQRKVMLVVVWPAAWLYAGLLFRAVPSTYLLRAALACFCWALLGYISHEVVSVSVHERQRFGVAPL